MPKLVLPSRTSAFFGEGQTMGAGNFGGNFQSLKGSSVLHLQKNRDQNTVLKLGGFFFNEKPQLALKMFFPTELFGLALRKIY